jgi:uncharacterized protein (DUF58 family)
MRPPAEVLDRLGRSRLLIRKASPNGGVGERRSQSKGAGLEFVDFRLYQEGDDTRHLDVNLYARHGAHFIRQYSVDRQLRITVIVDASLSMGTGSPDKFAAARTVANCFGFVGLAGGDLVQIGVADRAGVSWSPRYQGAARADAMFGWLHGRSCSGTAPFAKALRAAVPTLKGGLLILISDWWMDDVADALKCLDGFDGDIVAVQMVSPEEDDPGRLGEGAMRLLDAESGDELELMVDPHTLTAYGAELARFRETLRAEIRGRQGRFIAIRSDVDMMDLFGRQLRVQEVIG